MAVDTAAGLPDSDDVSGGLRLQQAEVEADAMTNGHGDQPDTVLGAGVWTGEARRVHSAVEGGDVPTAGDCQGGDTNRSVLEITPQLRIQMPSQCGPNSQHRSPCSRSQADGGGDG